MNTKVREEFGLHWLYNKFDESAGLLPFPDEAARVLRRLIADKEIHSSTFTAATSARRLVEHWLDTHKLPMWHNGVKIGQQMSGAPAGGELSDYIALSDSIDGQTSIRREDLVGLMLAEDMTVPPFLLPAGAQSAAQQDFNKWLKVIDTEDRSADPVYAAAWEFFQKRDLWANMQHQNDPIRFEKISAQLSSIDAAIAALPTDGQMHSAPPELGSTFREVPSRELPLLPFDHAGHADMIGRGSFAADAVVTSSIPTPTVRQPRRASEATVRTHKLRKNSLDAPIEKAIRLAKSTDTAAVFLELRSLALEEEKPFTGAIGVSGALCYTSDDGESREFTKNALRHRLNGSQS